MTARILAPKFNKYEIYFCGKKKGSCRVWNWLWLICHMSYKNINYTIFYYSSLQLTTYNAYVSLHRAYNAYIQLGLLS